jgi:hypothetical protein
MIGGHFTKTDIVLKKLADQIETGEFLDQLMQIPEEIQSPVSSTSQNVTAVEVNSQDDQERKKLLVVPPANAGVLSYRVNRIAIAAALKEAQEPEVSEASRPAPEVSQVTEEKKLWRSEMSELKTMMGISLSLLVAASTDRTRTEISSTFQPGHPNLQMSSLTQGILSDDENAEYAIPARSRVRVNFTLPVKPQSRSERAARFAAHGIILRKNMLPWKATPTRPVKFSLLDLDELRDHPGLVDGGDPWCSVFWASKAGDIHAGCHYRPIIL